MRDRSSEERDSQQASGRGAGIGVLSLAETRREDPSSQLTHTEYADLQTVAPPMVGMTSQSTENTQRSSAVTTRSSRETSRPMKDQPSVAPLHSARQTDMSASGGDRSRSEEKPRRAVLTTSKAPPHTDDRSKITPPRLAKQPSTTAAEASAFKEKVQQRRQGASPASGVKQATADVNQSQQSRTTGPSGKHIQSGPSPPISPFEIHRYQLQDIPPRALVSPFTQDPRRTKGPGLTRRRAVPLRSLVTEHLASEATAESSKPASSQQNSSTSGQRSLRLGIETEFLLAAKFTQLKSSNLPNFVKLLAERHNAYIGRGLPLMDPSLRDYYYHYANDYSKWSMAIDESCDTLRSPCKLLSSQVVFNVAGTGSVLR